VIDRGSTTDRSVQERNKRAVFSAVAVPRRRRPNTAQQCTATQTERNGTRSTHLLVSGCPLPFCLWIVRLLNLTGAALSRWVLCPTSSTTEICTSSVEVAACEILVGATVIRTVVSSTHSGLVTEYFFSFTCTSQHRILRLSDPRFRKGCNASERGIPHDASPRFLFCPDRKQNSQC
jgi:hypothetical protein